MRRGVLACHRQPGVASFRGVGCRRAGGLPPGLGNRTRAPRRRFCRRLSLLRPVGGLARHRCLLHVPPHILRASAEP
ncbi:putative Serine/arginine repetitive matrix protein 1 [Streptomyces viridochromogenes Tue57]|uniref:Putative Serine/arginine repetitive matrix protein 1 n=1 Tax=Streptomyces viridochromogenes Tue57 TaxID=1160705 RepID=L8PC61_STRVR|nr:putative Serine/arginine repetitive matrix protein 1 [Streptomyces viridochromogenes Tue57]